MKEYQKTCYLAGRITGRVIAIAGKIMLTSRSRKHDIDF